MPRMNRLHARIAGAMVGCALLGIAGCTEVSRGSLESVRLLWRGKPTLAPTAEQVAARPFYQMRATTAAGDAVLILGNVDGPREFWYGAQGVLVVLQHGRVVMTAGLDRNLDGNRLSSPGDPFATGLHRLGTRLAYERVDDWSPGYRYGVPVHAVLRPTGSAEIDILGASRHTLLITEEITATSAGYHVTNRYWVDPSDGFVWMSEQHVMPGLTMKLVQLRPYRGGTS